MNTRSAMASARVHTLNERLERDIKNTVNRLLTTPMHSVRTSTRIAQFILIRHETLFYEGILYTTQVRNIGAGVKELYLKEKK